MRKPNRILSLFLSIILILGLLPVSALAKGTNTLALNKDCSFTATLRETGEDSSEGDITEFTFTTGQAGVYRFELESADKESNAGNLKLYSGSTELDPYFFDDYFNANSLSYPLSYYCWNLNANTTYRLTHEPLSYGTEAYNLMPTYLGAFVNPTLSAGQSAQIKFLKVGEDFEDLSKNTYDYAARFNVQVATSGFYQITNTAGSVISSDWYSSGYFTQAFYLESGKDYSFYAWLDSEAAAAAGDTITLTATQKPECKILTESSSVTWADDGWVAFTAQSAGTYHFETAEDFSALYGYGIRAVNDTIPRGADGLESMMADLKNYSMYLGETVYFHVYGEGKLTVTKTGSSTVASAEVPAGGFAVQIVDESGNPVEGASVEATNVSGRPTIVTGVDGIAVFDYVPAGNGSTRKAILNVTKTGYQKIQAAERNVSKGSITAVVVFLDDGKVHISSAVGKINGTTVDLMSNYKYFKANSSDTKEADNQSNVKNFTIAVTASGGAPISKYQLLQGGSIVAESITSTITIPVLTGTPDNPNSYGSNWRITKLKAGQTVYLRVVDVNGVISDNKPLGIRVSEPTLYGASDTKGTINFGDALTINVPSNIPIIGDTEIELGWNGLPFVFEVSQSGKVKFAINPKANPFSKGSVDGDDLSNWDEVKKEYKDAMEQVALGRSATAKAFGGKPQKFGAGQFSVDASFMGYGEGQIDDYGNIIVDVGLVITVSEEGSYTWTYFLGYVPVYISVGEKVSVSGTGELDITRTDGNWKVSGAVGEINPELTLNLDGGVGVNGVLSVGASGRATLSWLNRWSDNYNRVNLTGEAYIVAKAFLFTAEKKITSGTWTIYDSYGKNNLNALSAAANFDFYNSSSYSPVDRNYINAPMLLASNRNTVKDGVYPDAAPRLMKIGNIFYLFWLDDVAARSDNDRTALVYATSQDCETWSVPTQVIPEASDGTADFAYDVCAEGNNIHIVISKANRQFGNEEITIDDMAASADIYYTKLDTTTGALTEALRITNNEYADIMPAVVADEDQTVVAYVENQLEGGLFGTDNSYTVSYQIIGQELVTIPVEGLISEMDAGVLAGQVSIGYLVDTDKDFNTDADNKLWVVGVGENTPVNCDSAGIHSPTFSTIGLLWYSDGNINYINRVGDTAAAVFESNPPMSLSNSFYVIERSGSTKIIWDAMSENTATNETAVYAADFDGNTWSSAYVLFEKDSELTSALSGYSDDSNDYIAYINTTGVYSDSQSTSLCVKQATPPTDIAIAYIDYVMNDVVPGEDIPMSLTIQNCGATAVDNISVSVNDEIIATISDANLGRGTTETYDVDGFTVSSNLDGVETYSLAITAENDSNSENNSTEFAIGYTDVNVEASPLIVNGSDCASITVSNNSNIVTDVTLRVTADEKDGDVLLEQKLSNLTKDASRALLLDLDSLNSGDDVRVYYVTATASKKEIATVDNSDFISLALGSTATYSLTVSAASGGTIIDNSGGLHAEGDIVSVSAAANDGYQFVSWKSSNGGSFDDATNANTTFVMPANDVTVTATFRKTGTAGSGGGGSGSSSKPNTPATPSKNPFVDVPAGSYYEDAVIWAVDKGITTGTDDSHFSPDGSCTRAQIVTFIYRALAK